MTTPSPRTENHTAPPAANATVQAHAPAIVEVPAKGKGGFSEPPTTGELIEFQFTGLLVVFIVLGTLTLLCHLIAQALRIFAPDQYYGLTPSPEATPQPVAQAAAPTAASKTIHPGLADEKLAAILAVAAAEAIGQPVNVVKFRHMGSLDWTWSIQGRVGIHSSHKL